MTEISAFIWSVSIILYNTWIICIKLLQIVFFFCKSYAVSNISIKITHILCISKFHPFFYVDIYYILYSKTIHVVFLAYSSNVLHESSCILNRNGYL